MTRQEAEASRDLIKGKHMTDPVIGMLDFGESYPVVDEFGDCTGEVVFCSDPAIHGYTLVDWDAAKEELIYDDDKSGGCSMALIES